MAAPLTGVRVLVVDDLEQNRKLMHAVLEPRGFVVRSEASGQAALEALAECEVDVVLLDVLMPVMDGYETCERIKADPRTAMLPVVMVTASGTQQRLRALEVGADDFITKPFDQAELVARVRSLARVKRLHDTVRRADRRARALERRARDAGSPSRSTTSTGWAACAGSSRRRSRASSSSPATSRSSRATDATSPRSSPTCVASPRSPRPPSRRRRCPCCATTTRALGELVFAYEGTLEHFAGDGLMVFFNDPPPCPDAPERAVRMALDMRDRVDDLASGWSRQGHDLGFGVGIAQGYATLGRVGFEGRWDYAAIGTVTNVAARLCAAAAARQILISPRVLAGLDERFETRSLGPVELRGISRPLEVHEVIGTTDREDDP